MTWISSDYTVCNDKELMEDYEDISKEILKRLSKIKSRKKLLKILKQNLLNITVPLLMKIGKETIPEKKINSKLVIKAIVKKAKTGKKSK